MLGTFPTRAACHPTMWLVSFQTGKTERGRNAQMCGIAGEIRFDGNPATLDALSRMNDRMAPRGPDAAGVGRVS